VARARTRRESERPATPAARRRGSRYTAPKPATAKHSPLWIPATMFACMLLGMAVIVADFLEILPGGQQTSYLLLGLGLLVAGFVLSTQYR
jgi:hypothetical protein